MRSPAMADGANKLTTRVTTGLRLAAASARGAKKPFLSVFSLPYTHYSLMARSEALRRYTWDRNE